MGKNYYTFCKVITNNKHQLVINGLLLSLGLYVSIQKFGGINLGGYLQFLLTTNGYIFVKTVVLCGIVYSSVVKVITHVIEGNPPIFTKMQEPESISECALVINNEIKRHLKEIISDPKQAANTFLKSHSFDLNVAHAVSNLADHLKKAFSHLKVKNRDVFISVYKVENIGIKSSSLSPLFYLTHWDPNRDVIFSKKIDPNNKEHKTYECVKAIKEGKSSVIKWDCSAYTKSKNNRGKIKHYIGFRFDYEGVVLGFLNIEFHNKQFFIDEEKMVDFVEKEIIAFKYLVEYQFLKRAFFDVVNEKWIKEAV